MNYKYVRLDEGSSTGVLLPSRLIIDIANINNIINTKKRTPEMLIYFDWYSFHVPLRWDSLERLYSKVELCSGKVEVALNRDPSGTDFRTATRLGFIAVVTRGRLRVSIRNCLPSKDKGLIMGDY